MAMNKNITSNKEITIFMPSLGGGGAEKIVIRLMKGFIDRGIGVSLLLATPHGNLHTEVPENINVVHLNSSRTIFSIIKLIRYIRKNKPVNILSHLDRANRVAILASLLAMRQTRVHIVVHNTMSVASKNYSPINKMLLKLSYRYLYPRAENIVHVSKAAAKDLEEVFGNGKQKVKFIYNPIVDNNMINKEMPEAPHKWFSDDGVPVILAVGRLSAQKDYLTLLKSFSLVRKKINSRLIILGEGEQRKTLEDEIRKNHLEGEVDLVGFVNNPFDFMRHADLFVLSSRWEALPTVLVEAMACGCPVVSTDCPSGPAEILENGKYGMLVPVRRPDLLADAIVESLCSPIPFESLISRAKYFSVERSVNEYMKLMNL